MAYRGLFTRQIALWAAVVLTSRLPVAMATLAFLFLGRDSGLGYSGGAAMAAAYAVAEAMAAPGLGSRLRTRPYRREVTTGLVLSAAAFALLAVLPGLESTVAVMLAALAGGAAAAAPGAVRTLVEDLAPQGHIGAAMSLESTLNMVAFAVSPALVSVLAFGLTPRAPFLVSAGATLAAIVGLWLLPDKQAAGGTEIATAAASLSTVLRAWPVYVTSMAAMYLLASVELTLPALLEHRGLPIAWSGPLLTGFAVASIIGSLVYGMRTWPGPINRQSTILLLAMIAVVAATSLATTWLAIAALLALAGILQAAVLITRNLTLRETLPADLHPMGYSTLYAGGGIGYGLSAAATGILLTAVTPVYALLIATAVTLVLTAATWFPVRDRRTSV